MAQFKDKYHKAARDGYLDMLREASRKDCDSRDEDGMTPLMWSSFYGRLDALRLLMNRGSNVDLTDYLGNTALHHAAANGHFPCCTFLVNFGANIWVLDNDMHSALDIAVLRNQREVIDYLDSVVGERRARNRKVTLKIQQRAVAAAEKRRRQYEKMQSKAQRRLEKDEQVRSRQRQKMTYGEGENSAVEPSTSNGNQATIRSLRGAREQHPPPEAVIGVARKVGKKKNDQVTQGFRISEEKDGHRSVRSLTGLKRDSEILYATSADAKQRDDLSEPAINGDAAHGDAGLFERPGFGSVAFLTKPSVSDALMSLPGTAETFTDQLDGEKTTGNSRHVRRSHSNSDSIGTAGSLLKRMTNLPWSEDEVENLDDDQATDNLELFLACHSLTECASLLHKEKIDLDALLLCNDEDLKKIGLHLGPRKKLLDAIAKRKMVLEEPGLMLDTYL